MKKRRKLSRDEPRAVVRSIFFTILISVIIIVALKYFLDPSHLRNLGQQNRWVKYFAYVFGGGLGLYMWIETGNDFWQMRGKPAWNEQNCPEGYRLYIVRQGDFDAGVCAANLLGSYERWHELLINIGRRQKVGGVWRRPNQPWKPGWVVVVPVKATTRHHLARRRQEHWRRTAGAKHDLAQGIIGSLDEVVSSDTDPEKAKDMLLAGMVRRHTLRMRQDGPVALGPPSTKKLDSSDLRTLATPSLGPIELGPVPEDRLVVPPNPESVDSIEVLEEVVEFQDLKEIHEIYEASHPPSQDEELTKAQDRHEANLVPTIAPTRQTETCLENIDSTTSDWDTFESGNFVEPPLTLEFLESIALTPEMPQVSSPQVATLGQNVNIFAISRCLGETTERLAAALVKANIDASEVIAAYLSDSLSYILTTRQGPPPPPFYSGEATNLASRLPMNKVKNTQLWILSEDYLQSGYNLLSLFPAIPLGFVGDGMILVSLGWIGGLSRQDNGCVGFAGESGLEIIRTAAALLGDYRYPFASNGPLVLQGNRLSVVVDSRFEKNSELILEVSQTGRGFRDTRGTIGELKITTVWDRPTQTQKEIHLNLFGPARLLYAPGSQPNNKAMELLAFICLNNKAVPKRYAKEAIWPGTGDGGRITQAYKEISDCLGVAPNGSPRFDTSGRQYTIRDIVCDIDLFRSLCVSDPMSALSLVSGEPLESFASSEWGAEIQNQLCVQIVTCAKLAAKKDPNNAYNYYSRALIGVPYDEELRVLLKQVEYDRV